MDIRLVISPSGYREPGAKARWFRLGRTPESGDLLPVSDVAAELRNPRVGGVYRIGAVYGGSPTNECVVVLPLAGASVDAMVRRNLSAAGRVVERIEKKYRPRERTYLKNGRRWFWSHGAGDFHGRPTTREVRRSGCTTRSTRGRAWGRSRHGVGSPSAWRS